MTWILARLEKGRNFPDRVFWPHGIDAVVPVSDTAINTLPGILPEKDSIQLYWKDTDSGKRHPLVWINSSGRQECALDIPRWIEDIKNETYRPEHKRSLISMFPVNYHYIPERVRYTIIAALVRLRSRFRAKDFFPVSFFNCGCEILLSVIDGYEGRDKGQPFLVLTHDIESREGFRWIGRVRDIEENLGYRSSWNVVPMRYPIDKDILYNLIENGHEIGLHGLWHNSSEAFLEEGKMAGEFNKLEPLMREFSIKGYRSPAWYRTRTMFRVLSDFFVYDLSCLDNDLVCPAGNGGVGIMRPFMMRKGLVELPCTLPFEAPLYFGVSSRALVDYWRPKIDFIRKTGRMLLVNTHPEPNYLGNDKMLDSYARLLEMLSRDKWRLRLPGDVAEEMTI